MRIVDEKIDYFYAVGNTVIFDVGGKNFPERTAVASGKLFVIREVFVVLSLARRKKECSWQCADCEHDGDEKNFEANSAFLFSVAE